MRVAVVVLAATVVSVAGVRAQPLGDAFPVDTHAAESQAYPRVAVVPDGGFIVAWESAYQDGDGAGVFARRFTANGVAQGDETQVNVSEDGPQFAADVAAGADGGFVVVWEGYRTGGGDSDVVGRRFAGNGAPQGGEIPINLPVVDALEGAPAVATTAGGFVVVWDDYEDVYARRFDGAGAPLGDPFQVNPPSQGFQGVAAVAATTDGGFVIAWEDGYLIDDGTDGSGYGVFARRYDAGGAAAGDAFQLNTTATGDQFSVALAAAPAGGFVAVWTSAPPFGTVPAADDYAIVGQRFDAADAKQGGEFRVNAAPSLDANAPSVAADQHGNWVVVWDDSAAILERRYSGAGLPLAGPTPVAAPAGGQGDADVGAAADGRYVVVWRRDHGDGSRQAIFARRFAAINQTPPATPTPSATPSASPTASATPTATVTPTGTASATPTRTGTPTSSAIPTASATLTATPSPTSPATRTPADTAAPATDTPSPSPTVSPTATLSPSAMASASATSSGTTAPSLDPTPPATAPPTATEVLTATHAVTATPTASPPASPSATASVSPSSSVTASVAPTATATASPVSSATTTAGETATPIATASATPDPTGTPSLAASAGPTAGASPSAPAAATASATAAAPDASATPLAPSATATAVATVGSCAGDCNGDGAVTVAELVTAVGIALDGRPPVACRAADGGGDGQVTIDDLLRAVTAALDGCMPRP